MYTYVPPFRLYFLSKIDGRIGLRHDFDRVSSTTCWQLERIVYALVQRFLRLKKKNYQLHTVSCIKHRKPSVKTLGSSPTNQLSRPRLIFHLTKLNKFC